MLMKLDPALKDKHYIIYLFPPFCGRQVHAIFRVLFLPHFSNLNVARS